MLGTIIVSLILIGIVAAIIHWMVKTKRSGKNLCSCGGKCSSCGAACQYRKSEFKE